MIFNRFAKEARVCVKAAVEEARMLGHDSVGDEELLLGILHADEGAAAEALSSVGISLEAAREAGEAFDMSIPENRRVPFSLRAKKALEMVLREGVRMRDNHLTSEHVVRGVLRVEHGMAARLLSRLGVSSEELEERMDLARE